MCRLHGQIVCSSISVTGEEILGNAGEIVCKCRVDSWGKHIPHTGVIQLRICLYTLAALRQALYFPDNDDIDSL